VEDIRGEPLGESSPLVGWFLEEVAVLISRSKWKAELKAILQELTVANRNGKLSGAKHPLD